MDNTRNTIEQNESPESWLERTQEKTKTDPYTKAILTTAMRIIDNKDYEYLSAILREYDRAIKRYWKSNGLPTFDGLPFWACPLD